MSLTTYNWQPSVQLRNFGPNASIAFLGDSTTDGFGTAPSNYVATTSLPAEVAAALNARGDAANQADFMGQGNELSINTDARITFQGGAGWGFPMAAGGEIAKFNGVGDGLTFAPGSGTFSAVTLDYIDSGAATLDIRVNGADLGTVAVGNTGLLKQATIALPSAEAVSALTVTDTNGGAAYIEGATLQSVTPSIQVIDAGVGGAQSSIVGAGQAETNPYNLTSINAIAAEKPTVAFVEFGINDVLQGVPAAQTTANVGLIVQELQAVGTEAVIVIPSPIASSGWAAEIPTLRADVDALATQLNVGVIDLSASAGDNAAALQAAGLLGADGVHPTAAYDASTGAQIAALLTGAAPATTPAPAVTPPVITPPIAEPPVGTRSAVTAAGFLNTLGVDTHIPYTDGGYANIGNVLADLRYLGVTNVRDGLSNGLDPVTGSYNGSAPLSSYETLARAGIKFTVSLGSGGSWTPASVLSALALSDQVQQAVPGAIEAVEGANEINNAPITWTGANGVTETGLQAGVDLQADLYTAVHSDPNLAGVPVVYFTGYGAGGTSNGPNPATTPGLADYDNQHPYPGSAGAAIATSPGTALSNEAGTQGAAVYTETGYTTNLVSQTAQARGDLNVLLDAAKSGVSQTYLYELMDAYAPGSPQGDAGWGLFGTGNVAKPAAVAIHNLTQILADPGATSGQTATAAGFTVAGLPSDGNSLDIEKSDGTHDLVVWNETSGTTPVTVALGASYTSVSVFDPMQGTAPIASYSNVSSVPLTLNGSPLIVQVSPSLSVISPLVVPAPVTPPAGTIGSGPNILALSVSEDYFNGDATYTVAVDGTQIGGLQTATASRAAGASQTLNVAGNFAGSHTVTVNFTNDAHQFSRSGVLLGDRNLYVNGATIDGSAVPGSALSERSGGPQSFTFTGGSASTTALPTTSAATASITPLTLQLSEDAYLGDAQFIYSIDGGPTSAPQTVTALHGSGQSQAFALPGLTAGAHDLAVSFINDQYAGTPSTDRNLYVDAVQLNGQSVPGATANIYGDWTSHFALVVPSH